MKRRTILAAAPLLVIPRVARAFHLSGGRPSGISPDGSQIDTTNLSSTLTNAYGVWGFSRAMNGPTGASPWGPPGETGPFTGPFCFVTLNGKAILSIGQFGPGPVRTGACTILIFNGGQVYLGCAENDRQWYRFSNYNGFEFNVGSPTISDLSTLPLPTITPHAPSSDGSFLTSTAGTLYTADGAWTNSAGGSSWQPTLNGIEFDGADPTHSWSRMQVACNGNMFLLDAGSGTWNSILSFSRFDSGSGTIPAGPIPITVTTTPNASLVTLPDPHPKITTGATIGTVIATIAVTMSDSSTFAGTLSTVEGISWLGFSGLNLVTTGTPTPTGTSQVTVAASQGGSGPCYPGASAIAVEVS